MTKKGVDTNNQAREINQKNVKKKVSDVRKNPGQGGTWSMKAADFQSKIFDQKITFLRWSQALLITLFDYTIIPFACSGGHCEP